MSKRIREPHIQSLRALAAILVLIYHLDLLPGGYIGVDIFYLLSGYLITDLLLRELEASRRIDFWNFYARRFKRLLPASFVVITTTGLTGWALLPATYRAEFGRDLIAASTYISNFLFAFWNNDYQNLGSTPSPFIHFWSLAVEEQFYLFWPLLIFIFFKIRARRGVFVGVFTTALLSFLFSLYLTERSPVWSFYILPTRAWEMAAGSLLLFVSKDVRARKFNRPQWGLLAFVAIACGSIIFNAQTAFPGTAALVPVLATSLLLLSRDKWPPFLDALSRRGTVQWLGKISYPLYLWHWPVLVIPKMSLSRDLTAIEIIIALFVILLLAELTNRFIEEPLRYASITAKGVYTAAIALTTFSVALGIFIQSTHADSVRTSTGVEFNLDDVRSKPVNDRDGCHIRRGETISPLCEYGDKKSESSVVLYGDSHAAQWLPALDIIGRENSIKIISLTKSACPSPEVIKELSSQYSVDDCQAFRDSSVARIKAERPLAVIMTGMQPFTAPYSKENARNWWLAGEAKALKRIEKFTEFPIYLTDTPLPRIDIPTCLTDTKKFDCNSSRPIPPEVAPGLIPINPTPWLCNEKCSAVIDDNVVYRDQSHLTVAISEYLAPQLAKELRRIGVIK